MIKENRVKNVMAEGRLALAGYVTFADPNLVEMMGVAGLDAAFIDMEHSSYDLSLVSEMVRACELAGITSVVRPPENDTGVILRLLDMGAQGIYIPHVNGVEGAREAIDLVRYPPMGHRGAAGGSRAAGYGSVPWQEHMARSNEQVFLAVMVEDQKAIDELDEIAALDGLDVVSVGPTDLSATLGVTDPRDPKLRAAVEDIANRIRRAGSAKLGFPVDHPACPLGAPELVKMGAGYSNMAPTPTSVVLNALRQGVAKVHDSLQQKASA
jgi:2-keto-3-deoxy-L-rhamnonate aldolase RhmA